MLSILSTGEGQVRKFECTLFNHHDVEPAEGVSGTCYRVTASFNLIRQLKKAKSAGGLPVEEAQKPKKKYTVPDFDAPKVLEEDQSAYEEELLFEPPPKEIRSRAHIDKILGQGKEAPE